MGYGANVYRLAKQKIDDRRALAEREAERRRREVYAALPRAEQLEKSIASCGTAAARAVVNGSDVTKEMEQLRRMNLSLQKELENLLAQNGYPSDYLEPHYKCGICKDTGYVEANGKTVKCRCYKNMLISCACEELNRSTPLALSTFDTFSLDYYSRETDQSNNPSPYTRMSKILTFCLNYAQNFSYGSKSILMSGATGLGKTHLSLAIANEVIKKGFGVIYVSAPALIARLEKAFFSKAEDNDSYLEMLTSCDLLIIDDLGTEFQNQFAVSQLYNLYNSRVLQRKPVIINTNLTLRELEKLYSERFVSRICGEAVRLNFLGKDIRIQKNL